MIISCLYKQPIEKQHQAASCKQHQNHRIIFQYDKMNDDKWTLFASYMDLLIEQSPLLGLIEDTQINLQELNFYWMNIHEVIMTAAKKHIPSYKVNQSKLYLNVKKRTETQCDLVKLNRIFHKLKTCARSQIHLNQDMWRSNRKLVINITKKYQIGVNYIFDQLTTTNINRVKKSLHHAIQCLIDIDKME